MSQVTDDLDDYDRAIERRNAELKRLRAAVDDWYPPNKCMACGAYTPNIQCVICGTESWEIFALRERALADSLVKAIRRDLIGVTPLVGQALADYDAAREAERVDETDDE